MLRHARALGLFALVLASPASADTQSEAVMRDFVAWIDSSPDWSASVSVLRSDGDETVADGLVFSREEPHVSISIEELRLRGLAAQGGSFTATGMQMRAGEIVTDTFRAKIPTATAVDAGLPSLAGITLDPQHMMRSLAGFYAIAAEGQLKELSIPEISVSQSQKVSDDTNVEATLSYRNFRLTDLSDGVIHRQEIGPITIDVRAPPPDTLQFSLDKVEMERLDLGAMAHILDETQYRDGHGDNVWRPLASRIGYSGMQATGADGVEVKLDEVAVENVDGRQPDEPFSDAWDQIMDPGTPQEAISDLALEAVTGMFRSFRVGTVRFEGMSVHAPKDNMRMTLDGVTLSGWSSDGLDSFILKNLHAEGADGYVSLDQMELAGFVSPDIRALVKFAAIEKNADPATHAKGIQDTFAALPRLNHFGIDNLVAGKSQSEAVSLDRLSLDFRDWNKVFAASTDVKIEGVKVPRALMNLEPQGAEMLDALGYHDLTVGMSLSDRWTPDIGTDQGTWTVKVEDAGDVELSYTLTGLTIDWLLRATAAAGKSADSEAALMAMLSDLGLARAQLAVTDRSLMDRVFGIVAQRQGLSVGGAAYREQMRAALPFLISAVIPAELAKRIAPPLQAFMAGGQTLFANVTPPSPLGVLDLMDAANEPLTLPDKLNLELKSEAAKE